MSEAGPAQERFGPFVLLRPLGVGGMGSAHLARYAPAAATDTALSESQLLVVKRLHPELMQQPTILERFQHEAEVATHVRHPSVAQVLAMGTVGSEPFLATEFVFGVQLSTLIHRIESGSTPPAPLAPALDLCGRLAGGLRAIHEAVHSVSGAPLGLLHRDIGARNVMVGYDGGPRIIDLGLGKSILSDWQTSHEVLAGSPDYMPPEQALGTGVDARADVYALAVTIWELLAGRRRIREDNIPRRIERCIQAQPEPIREFRPEVSRRFEQLLMEAMCPERDRRLPSAVLLEKGLIAEQARVRGRPEVAAWLDVACATLRARATRQLEADRTLIDPPGALGSDEAHVVVGDVSTLSKGASTDVLTRTSLSAEPYRGSESGWFHRTAARVRSFAHEGSEALRQAWQEVQEPSTRVVKLRAWAQQIARRLVGRAKKLSPLGWAWVSLSGAGLAFVLLVLLPWSRPTEPVPLVEPLPPPLLGETGDLYGDPEFDDRGEVFPEVAPKPRPQAALDALDPEIAPSRPGLSRAGMARRRRLVERIRKLRQRNYEVGFQRKVTHLSAQISRARSKSDLDALEREVRLLEERS